MPTKPVRDLKLARPDPNAPRAPGTPKQSRAGAPYRAVQVDGLRDYRSIPLERIHLEGANVRAEPDFDHVIELSVSISRHGLLEPIVVRATGDGYQLIAGLHRLLACRRLGWEEITAHVIAPDTATPATTISLIENAVRKDLTLQEECQVIAHLTDTELLSIGQICDLLGKSRVWVERRLMAPNLPPEVRDALFEGSIGLAQAEILGRIGDEAWRGDLLWRAVSQRLPARILEQMAEIYETTPSIPEAVQAGVAQAAIVQNQGPKTLTCAACGAARHYTEVTYVAICLNGCPPAPPAGPPPTPDETLQHEDTQP